MAVGGNKHLHESIFAKLECRYALHAAVQYEGFVTVRRVISIIVGVLATITGLYLAFLSVVVFFGYGVPEAPNAATGLLATVVLCVALGLLYVAYRSLRADFKKSQRSPDVR